MPRHQKNGLSFLTYSNLDKFNHLVHGSFFRHGGVSSGPYHSLNSSDSVGDTKKNVVENRKRIAQVLRTPTILSVKQVHGLQILDVDLDDRDLASREADALITRKPNKPIAVLHADCQAAIFFEPHKNVLCVAHAGWRGQSKYFYTKIIETMTSSYGCLLQEIHVSISPSLGPKNARFNLAKDPLSDLQIKSRASENTFDLWQAAQHELELAGILSSQIEIAGVCTFADPGCFSYRRDKMTGRMLSAAMLKFSI